MPDGVIVALGAHEPAQDYLSFYQAPSFYYLTGFKEPDAALVMVKKGAQVVVGDDVRAAQAAEPRGVDGLAHRRAGSHRADEHPRPQRWPICRPCSTRWRRTGMPFHVVGEFGAARTRPSGGSVRSPDEQLMDALQKKYPNAQGDRR